MNVGALSYLAGFVAHLILGTLLFLVWRGNRRGRWLIFASGVTAAWCAVLGLQEEYRFLPSRFIWTAELARIYVWLAFLSQLLNKGGGADAVPAESWTIRHGLGLAVLGQLAYLWAAPWLENHYPKIFSPAYQLLGQVGLSLAGLVLIEQYFRNARTDLRWRIKFLCFALGGMFAYDFYLYSDALLFHRINQDLWAARGAIAVLLTPLLGVAAARNPDWSVDLFVSRQVVFHSATLLGAGVYLLLMATAGYYIRIYGGEWGPVVQIVFLMGAFLLLALLLFSGQMRARIRVFLAKHFFSYAYDYRREWLRIINTLSDARSSLSLEQRIIMALGDAVESPSGVLWIHEPQGWFAQRASFGEPDIDIPRIDGGDPALAYIESKEWIINLDEMCTMPEAYEGITPPAWLEPFRNAWLLAPLIREEGRLYGVLLLTKPRTAIRWDWEAIDFLKTSGRLAASYLALEDAGRALTEARQFEGFNRLSAFVIHDLKNLIAQLSLVVRNAERHAGNPEFMSDAIKTVDHSVGKMSRLMSQLKNFGSGQTTSEVDLGSLLAEAIAARNYQAPAPEALKPFPSIKVNANRDRLGSALEHIIHNAQDAAGRQGWVRVGLRRADDGHAIIDIEDNGQGMDEEFIRTRLFKPFDTTKGLTGMGIGAYESREYIRALGGDVSVRSEPGQGTLFSCAIPCAAPFAATSANEAKSP